MENDIFIDNEHFNCPICHGKGCHYKVLGIIKFYTSLNSLRYALFVQCEGCKKNSMHFIHEEKAKQYIPYIALKFTKLRGQDGQYFVKPEEEKIHIMDSGTPVFCNLNCIQSITFAEDNYKMINESYIDTLANDFNIKTSKNVKENYLKVHRCLKQGLLVGASAYIRKTLEEIFVSENIDIKNKKIDQMVDELKELYPSIDECITSAIKQAYHISSDTIHGDSQLEFDEQQIVVLQRCLELIMEEIAAKKDKAAKLKDLSSLSSQLGQKTSAKKM